jgi:hypothetical protein
MTKRLAPTGVGGSASEGEARRRGRMRHNEIPSVDQSCRSSKPGHRVHWIHARKTSEPQEAIDVDVAVRDDGSLRLEAARVAVVLWNHEPGRLHLVWSQWRRALWLPRFHALKVPGLSGYISNMAPLDERTPSVVGPGAGALSDVLLRSPTGRRLTPGEDSPARAN